MPRFRVGHSVPINVYDGNDPVFQAHTVESAAELVELLNLGVRHKQFMDAWDNPASFFLEAPPQAPESAPEGEEAAVGWCTLRCGFCGHWDRGQFTKQQVAQWVDVHRNAMIGPNEGHSTIASTCPRPCGTP